MTLIEKIGQIAIPITDAERSIAFYRDTLGLTLLFRAGENLAFFDCGGVRLLLDRPEEPRFAAHSSVLYFSVGEIIGAFDHLRANGVDLVREPHVVAKLGDRAVWMAFFHDPDQNLLALMSEVPVEP